MSIDKAERVPSSAFQRDHGWDMADPEYRAAYEAAQGGDIPGRCSLGISPPCS